MEPLIVVSVKDHSKKSRSSSSDSDNDEVFVFPVDGIAQDELRVARNEERPIKSEL